MRTTDWTVLAPRAAQPQERGQPFGGMLRAIREERLMKLRELARRTHYSHSYLSKVEHGVRPPTLELAAQCDQALETNGALVDAARMSLAATEDAGSRPVQLPAGLSHFAGRADEMAFLTDRMAGHPSGHGAARVLAIDGPAGAGKSALAVHFAHRVLPEFPDGVLFADLHGFSGHERPADPADVLVAFLSALGVGAGTIPSKVDYRAALLRTMLYERRMLVVLDNAASSWQVRPLLPNSPTCVTLVTSRPRLSGLMVSHDAVACTLGMLAPADARALVRDVIGPRRADTDVAAVANLVRHCGNLPLALRVAAERVAASRNTSVTEAISTFIAQGDRLDPLDAQDDPLSIRTVLSWSYRGLEPAAARMFRLLSVCPEPVLTTPGAAALAGIPVGQARRLVGTLAGMHLIDQVVADHYRLHDLVRCYAAELTVALDSEIDRAAAVRRVRDLCGSSQESPRHRLHPAL